MGVALLFILLLTNYSARCHPLTEGDHMLLPPLYEMDDHNDCKMQNNLYCQAAFTLSPLQNSKLWKLIQISKEENFMFSRDKLHRAVCIPKEYVKFEDQIHFAERAVNETLKPLHLAAKTDDIFCYKELPFSLFSSDVAIFLYIMFVLIATFMDESNMPSNAVKEMVFKPFSLKRNLRKIFQRPSKDDYQRLKCIQGIRVLTCIGVILDHSRVSHFMSNHEVKRDFEEVYSIHYYWFIFDYFIIQIFLVISPWLLTVEVLKLYERNGRFTLRDAFLMFINRCCRLWPVLIAVLFILRNSYGINKVLDLTSPKILELSDKACRTNGMATVFFYQNLNLLKDSCNMGSWYASVDVQLYGLSLVILYLTLKKNSTAILKLSLLISYVIFAGVIYVKQLDVVFRPYPEFFHIENMGVSTDFMYLYFMTYVHAPTYLLGICFGIYYHRHKAEKVQVTKTLVIFWVLSVFCLPVLVIAIAAKVWEVLPAAIIGPLLKPMFAFSFAMGILAMSKNVGGSLKRFLECRPLEILSKITYSTYIFHFVPVFTKSIRSKQLLKMDGYTLTIDAIQDISTSFLIGLVAHLFIEIPWMNIQKAYIPNVKKENSNKKAHFL